MDWLNARSTDLVVADFGCGESSFLMASISNLQVMKLGINFYLFANHFEESFLTF